MGQLSEFQEFVIDQLGEAGDIQAKRMFGGVGVYVDEVFCAILTGEGRFYLRVDDGNREAFANRGLAQMRGNGKAMMPYFQVPAEVIEDGRELAVWATDARAAALRAKAGKKARGSRSRTEG